MITQLIAHAAGESILCMRGGEAALPKLIQDSLLSNVKDFSRSQSVTYTGKVIISMLDEDVITTGH